MKLDRQKWIKEVRRVETEIKLLKKMMKEPGYETTFPFSGLFELKAEATRLYTLRRVMKKKEIQLKSFHYFLESSNGKYIFRYWKGPSDKLTSEQKVAYILDGVPSWKATLMEPEITSVENCSVL